MMHRNSPRHIGIHASPRLAAALACLVVLMVALPGAARAVDITVVVHPGAPMTEVSVEQLREIFLGEMTFWDDARLVPITFQHATPAQDTFLQQVLGVSGNVYKTYWIKRIFREGGIPPLRVASEGEMMSLVEQTPGAIGFVSTEAARGNAAVRSVLRLSGD